jgi:uncharacterized iron-regulated membrane protein
MEAFRRSMSGLHTWAGVVCSALLFAMFWMGTLSVFDREIDQWMKPYLRLSPDVAASAPTSLDQTLQPLLAEVGDRPSLYIYLPKEREPTLRVGYDDAGTWTVRHLDPANGAELAGPDSLAGTGFIFPFHFSFHISWAGLGYWIAGFLAMAMLALLASGIVIHRKIITEFFTFRPDRKARRATLDLHNMTSLVALPFHVMLPLTGLFIFFSIYLPWSIALPFGGDTNAFFDEMYGTKTVEAAGKPAAMASLDVMLASAEARWRARDPDGEARPDVIELHNWGDANARVSMQQVFPARAVAMRRKSLTFDGVNGAILSEYTAPPVRTAHAWLAGMHFIQFDHWVLRWLYFVAGLTGCTMIATGLLIWLRSRETRQRRAAAGFRAMEATTIASVTGIILATGAFLVANRLLPEDAAVLGEDRAALEVWVFDLTWAAALLHAVVRQAAAWREQCWAIAGFALAAACLNAVTTGDHPLAAASSGLWSVASLDLALLTTAAVALLTARRMGGSTLKHAARPAVTIVNSNPEPAE